MLFRSSSSSSSSPLSISGGLSEGLGVVKDKGGRAVWVTGGSKKTGGGGEKKSALPRTVQRPGKRPVKRPARHLSDEDSPDDQETLGTCFKDSDYGEAWFVAHTLPHPPPHLKYSSFCFSDDLAV